MTVSLADASAAIEAGMPSPAQDRFEDLLALPVEVGLDRSHLRRVRFTTTTDAVQVVESVTLSGFGVDVDAFDWSRLPTFRSPEEAETLR